ncbi:MAG: DUF5709 domain-containing protein [Micromonosporaceae bacterium]
MTEYDANDPAQPPGAAGIPDTADDEGPRRPEDEDPQRFAVPGDEPMGVDEYGTTPAEARHGEPLSGRLNREEPDTARPPESGDRIVEPDEGVREDVDKDMVGREAPTTEGDLSAEEIAVNEEPTA